jgi:hypothetical protein
VGVFHFVQPARTLTSVENLDVLPIGSPPATRSGT